MPEIFSDFAGRPADSKRGSRSSAVVRREVAETSAVGYKETSDVLIPTVLSQVPRSRFAEQ